MTFMCVICATLSKLKGGDNSYLLHANMSCLHRSVLTSHQLHAQTSYTIMEISTLASRFAPVSSSHFACYLIHLQSCVCYAWLLSHCVWQVYKKPNGVWTSMVLQCAVAPSQWDTSLTHAGMCQHWAGTGAEAASIGPVLAHTRMIQGWVLLSLIIA